MANLFIKQAKQYAAGRPAYPPELFHYIASKTPVHGLAWDVGTGTGQAAQSLAGIYTKVIATDTSLKQLEHAPKLPNIHYHQTTPAMTTSELDQHVGSESTVDLVTVAQAIHWFDRPNFYRQVKWLLKKPDGVIAVWCYTTPEVNQAVDTVFQRFYNVDCGPYWDPLRQLVDEKYAGIDFPFEPIDGSVETGPFEFVAEKVMSLDDYFVYLRSWSAYQTAKEKGLELLREDVIDEFKGAWSEDGIEKKTVRYPIYLKIGKVGGSY